MDTDKIEKAMEQAKASLEIEGMTITPEQTALVKARLMDEISEKEFQEKIMKIVSKKE